MRLSKIVKLLLVITIIILLFFVISRGTSYNDKVKTPFYIPALDNKEESDISTTTDEKVIINEPIKKELIERSILISVPFTSQAPFGDWEDQRFQDGCEEASVLMAMRWVSGKDINKNEAKEELLAIAKYEQDTYGSFADTSTSDTVARIFNGYYKYSFAIAKYDINIEDIKQELWKGNLVIVPTNGRELNNPYYTVPGPERHNLLIRGYDADKKEFITNDAGTKRGEGYRYNPEVLFNAIYDYPTGDHLPTRTERKAMIIIYK